MSEQTYLRFCTKHVIRTLEESMSLHSTSKADRCGERLALVCFAAPPPEPRSTASLSYCKSYAYNIKYISNNFNIIQGGWIYIYT